jgi:hypothetical protein
MSDELMPFTKSKISLMSCPSGRSLYQGLKDVTPSASRVILSSKSEKAGVIMNHEAINPYEKELGALMDRLRILLAELKMPIKEVCTVVHLRFMIEHGDRHYTLSRATKREMPQLIADQWEKYRKLFIHIAVTHRTAFSFSADQLRADSYKMNEFTDD